MSAGNIHLADPRRQREELRLRRGCMCRTFAADPPCPSWALTLRCPTTERCADNAFGPDIEIELGGET